jgi:hypothetical protein
MGWQMPPRPHAVGSPMGVGWNLDVVAASHKEIASGPARAFTSPANDGAAVTA